MVEVGTAVSTVDSLFEPAAAYFQDLQSRIVAALEELDGCKFVVDDWQRDDSELKGFGKTRVIENSTVLEKAGVNFSQVGGTFSESFAATMPGEGRDFLATGISLVLHARNPWIPTVHMNFRRLSKGSAGWFGGGADLTPSYFDRRDASDFHNVWREVCGRFSDIIDWRKLKADCDKYFWIPHRNENRGVGGIFFDHAFDQPERMFEFVQAAGDAFLASWLPIAQRHKDKPFTQEQRQWQLLRRGRYVEFNLVCDRGTLFGLKTGGRIESILMSLPAEAAWKYGFEPLAGSREAEMVGVLRKGFNAGEFSPDTKVSV